MSEKCNHEDPDHTGQCIKCQKVLEFGPLHWWVFQKEGDFKCSNCELRIYLGDGETLPMGNEPDEEPCPEGDPEA